MYASVLRAGSIDNVLFYASQQGQQMVQGHNSRTERWSLADKTSTALFCG